MSDERLMMPGIPLDVLANPNWQVRTDRVLYRRYERERFSGGVNLSAQARNRDIDGKVYVFKPLQTLIVSPRTLMHLEGLRVT